MTILRHAISLALCATFASVSAGAQQRTYINPVDLDYRYNFEQINDGVPTAPAPIRLSSIIAAHITSS